MYLVSNFLPKLKKISDYLLGSAAFPASIIVALNFRPIFFYDRELILTIEQEQDGTFPAWLNYVVYLAIVPVSFIQFYVDPPMYESNKASLAGLYTFATVYIVVLFAYRSYEGHYVYPFLDIHQLSSGNVYDVIDDGLRVSHLLTWQMSESFFSR